MKRFAWTLLASLLCTAGLAGNGFAQDNMLTDAEKEAGWRLLFDGKTLLGWVNRGGPADWHVENGLLYGAPEGRAPGYIGTYEEFKNFHLKVDFMQDEGHNSGVFIRGPRDLGARVSQNTFYEINIADQHGSGYVTGSIVDLVKNERTPMTAGKWNTMEITATARQITIVLNGETVADIQDNRHYNGVIVLQAFGQGGIRYKNIKIREME